MELSAYQERFGFQAPVIDQPPHTDLGMVVVIPCFNETQLVPTLQSLADCELPDTAVEVLVVINSGEQHPEAIRKQNEATLQAARAWSAQQTSAIAFHWIVADRLPRKHAGVGLARRIGLDEAAARLYAVQRPESVLLCYDADCLCAPNYLKVVYEHFLARPKQLAASIHFEHPLEGEAYAASVYEAIAHYELFLRYYRWGLHWAGHPFAYHTIGSSMAVRAHSYLKQGGMNRRKAGEDFYFLQKLIPLGNFGEITTTKVIPAPRASDRVPFGTGRAVGQWLDGSRPRWEGYHPQSFHDLKQLLDQVEQLYDAPAAKAIVNQLSPLLQQFLATRSWEQHLAEIRNHSGSQAGFVQRFFRWFNAFEALKWVHYARDNGYPDQELTGVAREWLGTMGQAQPNDVLALLAIYRQLDINQGN